MKTAFRRTGLFRRASALALGLLLGTGASQQLLHAELLLRDDFNGTGIVNPRTWRLPFGEEGSFVGRTQFRGNAATDMPLQGVTEALASDGKVAELHLDTYSPIDAGNQFLGTDLLTKRMPRSTSVTRVRVVLDAHSTTTVPTWREPVE